MQSNKVAVRVISDGSFLLDGGPVFGPVPKILWERTAKPDRKNRVRLGLNSLLIMTPEANVLVDAGDGLQGTRGQSGDLRSQFQQTSTQPARARCFHSGHRLRDPHPPALRSLRRGYEARPRRQHHPDVSHTPSTSCNAPRGRRPSTPMSAPYPCTATASNTSRSSRNAEWSNSSTAIPK